MLISAIFFFFFFFFFLFFFCFLLWGQLWYDTTFPKVAVEQRGSWPYIKKYRPKSVGMTDWEMLMMCEEGAYCSRQRRCELFDAYHRNLGEPNPTPAPKEKTQRNMKPIPKPVDYDEG